MDVKHSICLFAVLLISSCTDQVTSFRAGESSNIPERASSSQDNKKTGNPVELEPLILTDEVMIINNERIDIDGNILSHENEMTLASKLINGSKEDYGNSSAAPSSSKFYRMGMGFNLPQGVLVLQAAPSGTIFRGKGTRLQKNMLDLLVVLDNTSSTFLKRQRLAVQLPAALRSLSASNPALNWNVAVTSMSVQQSECLLTIISSSSPTAYGQLQMALSLDTTNDDDERPFLMAARAMASDCNVSGQSGSWRRLGVPFSVMFFSDEDSRGNGDILLSAPDEALLFSNSNNSGRNFEDLNDYFAMIAGSFTFRPTDSPTACSEGVAQGNRYSFAMNKFVNRVAYNICQADYTMDLNNLFSRALSLSNPRMLSTSLKNIVYYSANGGPQLSADGFSIAGGSAVDLNAATFLPFGAKIVLGFTLRDSPPVSILRFSRTKSKVNPSQNLPFIDYAIESAQRLTDLSSGEIIGQQVLNPIFDEDYRLDVTSGTVTLLPLLQRPSTLTQFYWIEQLDDVRANFPALIKKNSFKDCQIGKKVNGAWIFSPYTLPFNYNVVSGEVTFNDTIPLASAFKCHFQSVDDPILLYKANLPVSLSSPLGIVDAVTLENIPFTYDSASDQVQFEVSSVYQGRSVLLRYKTLRPDGGRFMLNNDPIADSLRVRVNDNQVCEKDGIVADYSLVNQELELKGKCLKFEKASIRYRRISERKKSFKFGLAQINAFAEMAKLSGCQPLWKVTVDGKDLPANDWVPSEDGLGVDLMVNFDPVGENFLSPKISLWRGCET